MGFLGGLFKKQNLKTMNKSCMAAAAIIMAALLAAGCGAKQEPAGNTGNETEAQVETTAETTSAVEVEETEETEASTETESERPAYELVTGKNGSQAFIGAELIEDNGKQYVRAYFEVTEDVLQDDNSARIMNDAAGNKIYGGDIYETDYAKLAEEIGSDANFPAAWIMARTDLDVSHDLMMPGTTIRKFRDYEIETNDPLTLTIKRGSDSKEITLDPAALPGAPTDDYAPVRVPDPEKWLGDIPNNGNSGRVAVTADKLECDITIDSVEAVEDEAGYSYEGQAIRVTATVTNASDAAVDSWDLVRAYQWVMQDGVSLSCYHQDLDDIAPGETVTLVTDYMAVSDSPVIVMCGYFTRNDLFGQVYPIR